MRKIYYWPDGFWCDKTDLPYIDKRSDDFGWFEVGYEMEDETIDNMVHIKCAGERNL